MSEQQKKGRLGEVIRFVVTGGVCFLIEQAVLSLLKEIFGLDVNIGTPIAFLVSVVANYLLCVNRPRPRQRPRSAALRRSNQRP